MKNKRRQLLDTVITPYSQMTEEFKKSVAGVSQQLNSAGVKAVVICGVAKGCGSTTFAACLAEQEAMYKKVLLIDCNMSCPQMSRRYALDDKMGISNYCVSKLSAVDVIFPVGSSLFVVPAGSAVDKAQVIMFSGAFESKYQELVKGFDMVIIDTADCAGQLDAIRLGGTIGKILLVVGKNSARKVVSNAFLQCDNAELEVVGIVLNAI